MENVIEPIKKWFVAKERYFKSFARKDTRVESWFKAELLVLFEQLASQQLIEGFGREISSTVDTGRKQIDFMLRIKGEEHFCELKAMCISQAMRTPRNLRFYFRNNYVGLVKDFKKLDEIVAKNKWVLAFIYPKPSHSDWEDAIISLPEDVRHWHCVTSIEDYPEYLFIAVWRP